MPVINMNVDINDRDIKCIELFTKHQTCVAQTRKCSLVDGHTGSAEGRLFGVVAGITTKYLQVNPTGYSEAIQVSNLYFCLMILLLLFFKSKLFYIKILVER